MPVGAIICIKSPDGSFKELLPGDEQHKSEEIVSVCKRCGKPISENQPGEHEKCHPKQV